MSEEQKPAQEAPKPKQNPARKPVHAASFGGHVLNPPPGKHIVWVSSGESENNHEYYQSIGYEVERFDPKFPLRIRNLNKMPKPGEPYVYRGQVLMSCSTAHWEDIQENGPDGNSGKQLFAAYMRKIFNNTAEDKVRLPDGVQEEVDIRAFERGVFR